MIEDPIRVPIPGGLDLPLPRMVPVRQRFAAERIADIPAAVRAQLARPEIRGRVKPGARIAVGFGSRGIANIGLIARTVIAELIAMGAKPFVFPAMGSHGAASAEGQKKVLEGYGISEATTGVPILATMETEIVGYMPDGTPVHMDRNAAQADGIVHVNRIKPHTAFRGAHESGLIKMIAIGMGKIVGAATLHSHGMDRFDQVLPAAARVVLAAKPMLFAVGIVENALDQTAIVEAVPADRLFDREPQLLEEARRRMAQLYFDDIDVLVIEEMGKNISGAGFDPNITGRQKRNVAWQDRPRVQKIVVLSLTPETHGNATGIGSADVTTMRVFRELDPASTYANVITSRYLDGGAIPMVMNTDREAIALAVKTVVRRKPEDCRIVRIRNTLHLSEIEVSEPMLDEVRAQPARFEILGPPQPMPFDEDGTLPMLARHHAEADEAA